MQHPLENKLQFQMGHRHLHLLQDLVQVFFQLLKSLVESVFFFVIFQSLLYRLNSKKQNLKLLRIPML